MIASCNFCGNVFLVIFIMGIHYLRMNFVYRNEYHYWAQSSSFRSNDWIFSTKASFEVTNCKATVVLCCFQCARYFFSAFQKCFWFRKARFLLLRFSKTREPWSSKANSRLRSELMSIILAVLLGNRILLKKGHALWFVISGFRSFVFWFCVSRFVACDRNQYDRLSEKRNGKLKFLKSRFRVLLKSAVRIIFYNF